MRPTSGCVPGPTLRTSQRRSTATHTFWHAAEDEDQFGSYKLLIADVIDGRLKAVPRAIMATGSVMQRGRGGVDLPAGDIDRVKAHLAQYYEKMNDTAPWDRDS